jgi:hypothetical protein
MAIATRRPQGRYPRAAAHRGQGLRRRRPAEPTGLEKLVRAMLPGVAARKAAPGSRKGRAGGLALAAAAAGDAFKNRGKLARKRHDGDSAPPSTPVV